MIRELEATRNNNDVGNHRTGYKFDAIRTLPKRIQRFDRCSSNVCSLAFVLSRIVDNKHKLAQWTFVVLQLAKKLACLSSLLNVV